MTAIEDVSVTPEVASAETARRRGLQEIWETKPGLMGFFGTVDHKEIGIRYIVTAFAFLGVGGIEALIMRLQLAGPNWPLLTPEQYDQLFSTHGMTMIFLYAMPILSGLLELPVAASASARATWPSRVSTRCPTGSISPPASSSTSAS